MHLFVTGATGLIGGGIARRLAREGHTVTALARSESSANRLASDGLRVHRGDIDRPDSLRAAVAAADGVVHVAVGFPKGVTDADVAAVDTMIEALEGRSAPFILTSGLAVYAGIDAPFVDEDTPLDTAIPAQLPRIRLEERVIRASERGVRTVVLRPAHVYGHGQAGRFTVMQLEYAERAGLGGYVGEGTTPYSSVHIDDLAAVYVAALERAPAGSLYNVLAQTVSTRELAGAVSHAAGAAGRTASLSPGEAREAWGPLSGLLAAFPVVSALRAVVELEWTPRAATLPYELVHGSLRRSKKPE